MIYSIQEDKFHFDIGGNHHVHEAVWMIASKSLIGNWSIISHGPEVNVKDRYKKMVTTFESAGLQEEADDLYLFDASLFGIEEISTNRQPLLVNQQIQK